ncbi:nitroreductase/quinone reductase family protein [Kibdelosporangium persicum]|uniref:Nitroreductase family deazaflavin-dependent oxidoreductase n=1 Tax=Kibdelosporangium persicum TaxID=2698649 RepID=A0ABX2F224_9PSEU|nr:nitroreductase/quinone reductase family protein [Kibdelosporangium persicum]NRN65366.1 Nitroreductase family deazaflavin-dependent oxidoreductase [Kibdelosporangium persicum]
MSDFNAQVIEEFRANKGVVGGFFQDANVTLLHHKGRRSGREMITPLLYMPYEGSYVLMGSAGGAQKTPDWFLNIEAADEVTIEVGEQTLTVKPVIFRQGPEWLRIYTKFAEYWPDLHKYEEQTERRFPFARLDPVT